MTRRLIVFTVATTLLLYTVLWLQLSAFPFLDVPNHLARAHILSDLIFNQGRQWGDIFTYSFRPDPYWLGDMIVASLMHLAGYAVGAKLWICLVFFSLPVGAFLYARGRNLSLQATAFVVLLAVYLATDWMFLTGFLSFQCGVGLLIITLAVWRKKKEHAGWAFLIISLGALATYLMHFATFVFLGMAVGVVCFLDLLNKRIDLKYAASSLIPLCIVSIAHLVWNGGLALAPSSAPTTWRTPLGKLLGLATPFIRYSYVIDGILFLAVVGLCLLILFRTPWRNLSWSEDLVLAVVFVLAYLALPLGSGGLYDIDNRALIPAIFFCIVWTAQHLRASSSAPVALAAVIVAGNLGYIWPRISAHEHRLTRLQEVMEHVPPKSTVLPISTIPNEGRIDAFAHAGSDLIPRRGAVIPYLYGNGILTTIRYFGYKHRLYAPYVFWYTRKDEAPDWSRIRDIYEYILITRPFDPARIGVAYTPVFENETGSLLRIRPAF